MIASTTINREEIIDTTENCRYCLMCRHIVPLEQVAPREDLSPHGLALIVASERRGLIEWNEKTVDLMFTAVDSGNSQAHCITDQPLPHALAAVRAQLAEQNLAPAAAYEVNERLKKWGTPFAEKEPKPASGTGDTALFIGDEAQYLWPEAVEAALKLLKAAGVEPVLIGVGRNSGLIASSIGFPDTAAELAQTTLDELQSSGANRLLVLSAGDYFTFTKAYPERLGLSLPNNVECVEVLDLLGSSAIKWQQGSLEDSYAYVDPTHAVRVEPRHDLPRELLKKVMKGDARELFWRRERAHPAGTTYIQFTKPNIAEKLTHARLKDAQTTGVSVIVTEDAATLYQLNRFNADYGLQLISLYELLAEQLAG